MSQTEPEEPTVSSSVFDRRVAVRVLALWVAACLAVGVVVVVSHPAPTRTRTVGGSTEPSASSALLPSSSVTTPPTSSVAADTESAAVAVADSSAGSSDPTASDSGGIGSATDLAPGPIEQRDPAPCVASSSVSTPESLVVLDPANGCVRVLVSHHEMIGKDVTWSPDGSWLLATIGFDVVRVAADGSWRQDLGGGGQAESAVLSPDGTRLAITGHVPCCYLSEKTVLVVANSDGTEPQIAQDDIGLVPQSPVWSRDSQRFAYVTQPPAATPTASTLHVLTRDGVEVAQRSFPEGNTNAGTGQPSPALIGRPEWTSDGLLAAPVTIEQPSRKSLYWFTADLADAAGPDNPPNFAYGGNAAASPDGVNLLYLGYDPDHGNFPIQVWMLNRQDGSARQIVQGAIAPSWAPDGLRFAYATVDENAQIPDTAHTITVADLAGNTTPLWTVTNPHCNCWLYGPPVWSPNSDRLAIASHGEDPDT
jgi:hypothetical protein